MTRSRRVRRGTAAAVAAAALVAGCGSSSKAKTSATDSSPSPSTTSAASLRPELFLAPPPAPDRVPSLVSSAGLQMETAERLAHHVHSHLDVFVNGQPKLVPAGIGIVITDPGVHHAVVEGFDQYGGITKPCSSPCISPLHTHDVTGTLHTESATAADNNLGQFFKEWDVKLDDSCVADFCIPQTTVKIFVNGKEVELAKARSIDLGDGTEIAIVIGSPPAQIPATPNFQGG